ncbi:MAG: KamA family radical SAM protein [Thermoguttaceae bacterium]|nr:KamA family radical SAM protein [Thermoguttaceae bacterium]MDW8078796.1 KamA family radical SAM protein [Thermoguttaceae bacterium]
MDHLACSPQLRPGEPADAFGLLVPEPFAQRIKPGDPYDPLLRQVLPTELETRSVPGFSHDPLQESAQAATGAILRKYPGRCLVLTTARCAIHCRFCFRRCRDYRGVLEEPGLLAHGIDLIAKDSSIREVILSGGDPLVLDTAVLTEFLSELARIDHIKRVRIHSRVPIVLPQRVDEQLVNLFTSYRLPLFLVVHTNHPLELDDEVARAIRQLVSGGIPVLSQTVLLRGVNDKVEPLVELFERLLDLRVVPYYLHQLDRVQGAAHFEVSVEEGLKLVARLRESLPGYAVPRYVREVPGLKAKEILG